VPETGDSISFVSAYVMDFLSESKAAGFVPPPEMFASGLRNLQKMVTRDRQTSLMRARSLTGFTFSHAKVLSRQTTF
jgi:Large extracellular alpha-helical protein